MRFDVSGLTAREMENAFGSATESLFVERTGRNVLLDCELV
ncbi:MAG: hypothetical protein NTY90_04980 [Candidatus Micrarchaeota archaeon]|nr:hypothetical protein [Candidatus Micrarchaeota archaeon]